jgi:transposase
MSRTFKTVDYEATLDQSVRLGDCLPPDHLARFIVDVIAQLDLSAIYTRYRARGGAPYAPELLFGLLAYGYATGTFSSRKLERATYEAAPFRYIAGNLHPDHDTIASFRKTFLPELQDLFVQVLLLAQTMGVLKLGNISIDGTKLHADASKSKAVSYKRLLELETRLRAEVQALFVLAAHADQRSVPDGMVVTTEIALRETRLARLAEAKAVLQARAEERQAFEQAEYDAKVREREAKAKRTGKRPRGKPPTPPTSGPRDNDQYNFTDPDSRIMKNSTDKGFNQHYNAQVAVDHESFLIVGTSLSNHPTDQAEIVPTVETIPAALGTPEAAALDQGYFSATNVTTLEGLGIEPYIATGREPHQLNWEAYFAEAPTPPSSDASPIEQMAFKLRTEVGRAIYRLRKCTVEPVIGVIKEVLGFRQFSLRGVAGAAGEWVLVCLACNLKRLHVVALG